MMSCPKHSTMRTPSTLVNTPNVEFHCYNFTLFTLLFMLVDESVRLIMELKCGQCCIDGINVLMYVCACVIES